MPGCVTMDKKILLITNIFPPVIGGPATFIDRLGHALVQKGFHVTVICSSATRWHESDASRPFRVHRIVSRTQIELVVKMLPVMVWEMLRHNKVLVNGNEFIAWLGARIVRRSYILKIVGDTVWETARNYGVTALDILDFQTQPVPDQFNLKVIQQRRQRYLHKAQMVITPSMFLQKLVVGWGVALEKVRLVYNGIDLNGYSTFLPRKRTSNTLKVAFVGRLTNWKGVETLLLAASRLTDIEVKVIGEGPEYPLMVKLAEQLGLKKKVVFTGRMDQDKLKEILSIMDVLVLGSSYEGFSHTLLEASAIGLACIASDCGGNSELITHKDTGLLYPYGDVQALYEALLSLRDDEELRYRLACNARQAVTEFDFDHTVKQTIACLVGK